MLNRLKISIRSGLTYQKKIKKTFEKLGIPQAEQKFLAGVGAQFDSEVVYKNLKKRWSDQGVIFCDMSTALREHEELVKKYFCGLLFPRMINKFAALNSAVWSGGQFLCMFLLVYVSICHCRHISVLIHHKWDNLSAHL